MTTRIALIGFGEAARAFAPGLSAVRAGFDRIDDADMRDAMAIDGVIPCDSPAAALADAAAALSLVTADQALAAAQTAHGLADGAFWFDMNSVAPDTKRAAADEIGRLGGRYIDVAVMAPVHPARIGVPLLVAGPNAAAGADLLRAIGFRDVAIAGERIGDASAIKMIRSVMIKGMEALSAECAAAAEAAGVRDAVVASLDASWPGADWGRRFAYNIERMETHGARRAAELDEVAATLVALGVDPTMSRAAATWQRRMAA